MKKLLRAPDHVLLTAYTLLVAIYCAFLLTDGHFNLLHPVLIGLTFNSRLDHMLYGTGSWIIMPSKSQGLSADGSCRNE